jgi:S-layer homology domain
MIRLRTASAGLAVLSLLIAQTAHADLWDILDSDLKTLQRTLKSDATTDASDRAEALRERSDELFPALPLETQGTLEARRSQRTGDFVTIEQAGRTIVFHDVPLREWYAPYVRVMAERNVVSGYWDAAGNPLGEFRPGSNVSIEELAKIAVSVTAGVGSDCPEKSRNPTASGSWSTSFMACAESRQWVVYSDGSVDAKRPALRSEVMMTILQAYKKDPGTSTGSSFKDVQPSMQFASAIERAYQDGIVIGYTDAQGNALGMFGPNDPVTRAELVKILTIASDLYAAKEEKKD